MEKSDIVVVCCFPKCGKIKINESIWENEDKIKEKYPEIYSKYLISKNNKELSHGYCPDCYKEVIKELDNEPSNNLEKRTDDCFPIEMPPYFYA